MDKKELESKTKKDLVDIAKKIGMTGYSKLKKAELITRLMSTKRKQAAKKETDEAKKSYPEKKITGIKKSKMIETAGSEKASKIETKEHEAEKKDDRSKTFDKKYQSPSYKSTKSMKTFSSIDERELPPEYSETKIVFMPRDPQWAFVYWEINNRERDEFGIRRYHHDKRMVLRIYELDDNNNEADFFDIDINDYASSWYVNLPHPNRKYRVDIAFFDENNNYREITKSNIAYVPRENVSDDTTVEWMSVDDDFNMKMEHGKPYDSSFGDLYRVSGGEVVFEQSGSFGLKKIKPISSMEHVSSGAVSSFSLQKDEEQREKSFWLVVDTELIVYGATEPGSKVFIQGKEVPVKSDGTFSTRYYLPDGTQNIPVKAINSDEDMEEEITPIVTRVTK